MQKCVPFMMYYGSVCCVHVNYIVYKHFDRSLHVGHQTLPVCKIVPLTVFEILGFKLKNENDKKNCRQTYILTLAVIPLRQKWSITVIINKRCKLEIFECTGIMGQDLYLLPTIKGSRCQ